MTDIMEVLFSCDNGENNQISCSAWDYRTGTNLMNYKGGGSVQQQSFSILGSEYIIAANSAKPLLHVWPINAQEQLSSVRFVVPGRVNTMELSPDGIFLIAGIQEVLYVWHLNTGRMLNTISKHYQAVNCIKFTDDSSHFVSAGKDGAVLVWNLTKVLSRGDNNQEPIYSFTDHGLPVTDVYLGAGGIRAYMYTVSIDRTCKVYDLSSGTLLLNVVFAECLHSFIANTLETSVYVGTNEGHIYQFHLSALPRTKECNIEKEHTNVFNGHKPKTIVNCLALSVDGQTLISGGEDEQVCIWHIPSRQLLKSMPHKGRISNLKLRVTTPAIFQPEHKQPQLFQNNLKRMIDPPEADEDEVIEILVCEQSYDNYYGTNTKSETNVPIVNTSTNTNEPNESQAKEIEKLQNEIRNLKSINKKLFEVSAKQIIHKKKK